MMSIFNPHTVLELVQLSQEDVSWLRQQAKKGLAWNTVENPPEALYDLLAPVWFNGEALWEGSNDALRDEHLQPCVPFWEFLLLGWAQVRLRGLRSEMTRRDIAWAAVVKSCIVGFYPDFPGSSDYAYKHGRDRVLQLAETLNTALFPRNLEGDAAKTVNRGFTMLAFGMLLDMLLDPDRDLLVGRITRAIGLLDKAKQFVKSEDVAQARKLLAEVADVKALSPGAQIKMKGTPDWFGFRTAINAKFDERQKVDRSFIPSRVAQLLDVKEDNLWKLVEGELEGDDPETRLLGFMFGQVMQVPFGRFLR